MGRNGARLGVLGAVEDIVPDHAREVEAAGRERGEQSTPQNEVEGVESTVAPIAAPRAMSANAVKTFGSRKS